jgi:hypothetical protein
VHIVNDVNGEAEEFVVELVRMNENEDVITDDVYLKVFAVGDAAEGVAKNAGAIIVLDVGIEFVDISGRNGGREVFRVDEDGRMVLTDDLYITGVRLRGGIEDFSGF